MELDAWIPEMNIGVEYQGRNDENECPDSTDAFRRTPLSR
jgi:hypothetical protein